jgi:hypothetical protein
VAREHLRIDWSGRAVTRRSAVLDLGAGGVTRLPVNCHAGGGRIRNRWVGNHEWRSTAAAVSTLHEPGATRAQHRQAGDYER